MKQVQLRIAKTVISASGDDTCPPFSIDPSQQIFMVHSARPDMTLRVHFGDLPDVDLGKKVFHSGGNWSLYRHEDHYLIPLVSPAFGTQPYRMAIFNAGFDSGDLYIHRRVLEENGDQAPRTTIMPFEYPLDEVLIVNFLARKRMGVILHALGLYRGERGLVFCGVSGAGKSTMAELWRKTDVTLLSDDRIVLRREKGRFFIYGTPWLGTARACTASSAPLEQIYFIVKSPENYLKPLSNVEAATRLVVRCFPTFYDQAGMDFTLELLAQAAAEMPCYELGFVPDDRIVDFVRGLQ